MTEAHEQLGLLDDFRTIPALTNDDWYTPRWIFEAAAVTFDIDVAAPVNEHVRTCPARKYYTVLDDGLRQPWDGLIWCNPPYSRITPWVDRWLDCPDSMLLVPAAARVKWRRKVTNTCDALTLVDGEFMRDSGATAFPYALLLVARGQAATEALARVACAANGRVFK